MIITLIIGLSFIAIMVWLALTRRTAARTVALAFENVNTPVARGIKRIATPALFLCLATLGAVFGAWLCIIAVI